MGFKSGIRNGLWWVPIVALLVVSPYLWRGTSNGHDLTFHVNTWIDAARQWKAGIVYPHWAVFANYGCGEPRFVFYPPVSWVMGALLGLLLPWSAVPGTLSALVCFAAGVSMFLFAREWLDDRTSVLAAILYAVNPYLLVVIYERAAFGEMVAAIWLPGILLFALRDRGSLARNSVLLGLHVAAIWLTNLPSAVIASYMLAVGVLLRALQKRSGEPIARAAIAMILGLGLASFYLVPAAYEQRWVQIGQAVSEGASPHDNFLFAHTGDAEHDAVLWRTSTLALLEFVALVLFAALAKPLRQKASALYNNLVSLTVLAIFLMFPMSVFVWKIAPKLMFAQFPWRWLLVLNVVLAFFAGVSFARRRLAQVALLALVPLLMGACYWRFQQKIYPEDRPTALAEAIDSGVGYEGTDEYTPLQADNSNLDPYLPRVAVQIATESDEQRKVPPSSFVHTSFQRWDAQNKRFSIDAQLPTRDVVRLLEYPAWKVNVDGQPYEPEAEDSDGRIVLELPAGHHEVTIDYMRTSDRRWGFLITCGSFLLLIALYVYGRRGQTA